MYFNLALKNVRKSYRDYFVYFLTLTISVALFYLFNSFEAQQNILVADESTVFAFDTLTMAMGILSYFVTFVFGFLILYANNFIMKRRKKEIALYTLLGMKKSRISRVLLYETLLVGLLSLISGIALGIILSQGAAAFTGFLLEMEISYRFVVSTRAIVSTLFNFSIIFVFVGIFNNLSITSAKLIDLFKARQTNEVVVVKKPWVMNVIMIVSIAVLVFLYAIIQIPLVLVVLLLPILIAGSLATFGLFYSISFWFVKISQSLKSYYYRDLNAFTTRQISSKIGSTYKLLANVSLMLLLSFGALATAFNVNDMVTRTFDAQGIYDYSAYVSSSDSQFIKEAQEDIFKNSDYTKESMILQGLDITTFDIKENDLNNPDESHPMIMYALPIQVVDVKDYNLFREKAGKDSVVLKDDEALAFMPDNYFTGTADKQSLLKEEVSLYDKTLSIINDENYYMNMSGGNMSSFVFVVNEQSLKEIISNISPKTPGVNTLVYNLDKEEGRISIDEGSLLSEEFIEYVSERDYVYSYGTNSKADTLLSAKQSTLLITYIGLYLGLTFIVVCVMVISLQLLSEASDNYERYLLLDKIGVSQKSQKKAIFKQNIIYFGLPLLVALIHSFVGIKAVNANLAAGGLKTENYGVILIAVGILVSIYIIYFFTTYFSSVRMIFDRKK